MRVYGIVNHSPEEFIKALLAFDSKPFYYMVAEGSIFTENSCQKKVKYVLFLSSKDFVRSAKNLDNKIAIVFSSPIFFLEYSSIVVLDADCDSTNAKIVCHDNLNLDRLSDKSSEFKKVCSYEDLLEQKSQENSLLGDFMSFIYKLNVKTHQKPVKMLCAEFITSDCSVDKLDSKINALSKQIGLTTKVRETLRSLMLCDAALAMKTAFKKVRDYDSIDDVAEETGISAYEMRYIYKIIDNKGKHSVDDHIGKD